jgi:hypothetical protein
MFFTSPDTLYVVCEDLERGPIDEIYILKSFLSFSPNFFLAYRVTLEGIIETKFFLHGRDLKIELPNNSSAGLAHLYEAQRLPLQGHRGGCRGQ